MTYEQNRSGAGHWAEDFFSGRAEITERRNVLTDSAELKTGRHVGIQNHGHGALFELRCKSIRFRVVEIVFVPDSVGMVTVLRALVAQKESLLWLKTAEWRPSIQ